MDFVPIDPSVAEMGSATSFIVLAMLGLIGVALVLGLFVPEWGKRRPVYIALAAAFACLLAIVVLVFSSMGKLAERQLDIHESLKDAYGLYLDGDDLKALEYPLLEPSGGFVEYGSIERSGERLTLVWTGERLELGTVTGRDFTEFGRADG